MPKGDWIYLGEGSYNRAYKSRDATEVLKIQKSSVEATDTPERSVRLWNSINSHVPPPARLHKDTDHGSGWVCPFIEGVQASDKEMANALIDIFNKTGRVVVDATAPKNFVRTPNNQVLCVDVGMALQFERRENRRFADRRKSIVSLNAWSELSGAYEPFLRGCSVTYPETVNVVKALVFIKYNRPDIYDASFLKTNPDLVNTLANAYDRQNTKGALAHLDMAARSATFAIPQSRVSNEVQNFVSYLRDRGSTFALADDKVQDMSLSAMYTNPGDSNKPYVNIEIRNTEVATLFKHYAAEQERLVSERLASEKLAKIAEELSTEYLNKINAIKKIRDAANANQDLSSDETKFMTESCNMLMEEIQNGRKALSSDASSENQTKIQKTIESNLNQIVDDSKKIAKTNGFGGFINAVCELLGFKKPFVSDTFEIVTNMKQSLLNIKNESLEKSQTVEDNPDHVIKLGAG